MIDLAQHVFQLGVALNRQQLAQTVIKGPSVVVTTDGEPVRYSRCVAHASEDILTVTSVIDLRTVHEFQAGEWREADVYGADGQLQRHLVPVRR